MMPPTLGRHHEDENYACGARAELADPIRSRYGAATANVRRWILDEFIAASGYHEKSAIRDLNGTRESRERQTRKPPSLYAESIHFLGAARRAVPPGKSRI